MVELAYLHSACCGRHWELVSKNGAFNLECESCGKSFGGVIKITGLPKFKKCSCCNGKLSLNAAKRLKGLV